MISKYTNSNLIRNLKISIEIYIIIIKAVDKKYILYIYIYIYKYIYIYIYMPCIYKHGEP